MSQGGKFPVYPCVPIKRETRLDTNLCSRGGGRMAVLAIGENLSIYSPHPVIHGRQEIFAH